MVYVRRKRVLRVSFKRLSLLEVLFYVCQNIHINVFLLDASRSAV